MLTDPVALVAREVARIRRDDRLRVATWGAAWAPVANAPRGAL